MSAALLTLPAMRGSIVLGNPSWLLSHSVSPTIQKIPRKMGGKPPKLPLSERHPAVWGSHLHPQRSPSTWRTANRQKLLFLCAHFHRASSNARCLRQPHSHIHSGSDAESLRKHPSFASPRRTCLALVSNARRRLRLADAGGTSAKRMRCRPNQRPKGFHFE